jgi:hypothetical protein
LLTLLPFSQRMSIGLSPCNWLPSMAALVILKNLSVPTVM